MKNIIVLIICFFLCSCTNCKLVSKEVIIDKDNPKSTKIRLSMVGDVFINQNIREDAYEDEKYNFNRLFESVKSLFYKSDLMYYNQESLIGGDVLGYKGKYVNNTPIEFGKTMINMGFNVVSRANEHTLSMNEPGILNSCNFWNKYPNVLTSGSSCTIDEQENPNIMEMNGIRYTLLNYTTVVQKSIPTKEYFVNIYSDEQAFQDIIKIKNDVDIIIVAMHWGDQYEQLPSAEQLRISEYLASLGVNIIIGTHPKVIGPIRWIDNTLVLYSLGSFLCDEMKVQVGLLANIDIIKTTYKNNSKIELQNLETSLTHLYSNNHTDFQIIPFAKLNENILSDYKNSKVKYEKIIRYYENSIIVN